MAAHSRSVRTLFFAVAFVLAAACRSSTPPAGAPTNEPPASPTPSGPLPAASPTPHDLPPSGPAATPAPYRETGFFGLAVPPGWFDTQVSEAGISAAAFASHDPAGLAPIDDPGWRVPPDFAIGALVRSPLPAGADPDALRAGMEASLENFSGADLESLFAGAERIGLIDLAALETFTVTSAELGDLGGRPAIAAYGTADFGPGVEPVLAILAVLAWTDDSFFTFYGISTIGVWEEMEPVFAEILETVGLP